MPIWPPLRPKSSRAGKATPSRSQRRRLRTAPNRPRPRRSPNPIVLPMAAPRKFRDRSPPAMNISELRKAIDRLDAQIVKLLNERTRHVLEIGALKLKAGEEIYAPQRELAVLTRLKRI